MSLPERPPPTPVPRIPCAGAVVRDAAGRLLLVRRGRPPERGRWSLPGGRIEPGETSARACAREVREETGVEVAVGPVVGVVERAAPGGGVYVITDHLATPVAGPADPVAGDDADDAAWIAPDELEHLPVVTGLLAALRDWGVLT